MPAAAIHLSRAKALDSTPPLAKKKSVVDRSNLSFHHARRTTFTRFNLCVANREAGEPGSESPRTVRWHIVDHGYEGGFQWMPSTWAAAGGLRYGSASRASPENQARVFNSYEPAHPGAWPGSVPACSGTSRG